MHFFAEELYHCSSVHGMKGFAVPSAWRAGVLNPKNL